MTSFKQLCYTVKVQSVFTVTGQVLFISVITELVVCMSVGSLVVNCSMSVLFLHWWPTCHIVSCYQRTVCKLSAQWCTMCCCDVRSVKHLAAHHTIISVCR